jgi:hypothetical protein
MKQQLFFTLAFAFSIIGNAQNVGIGVAATTRAKLEVQGATGATSAIFGGESSGVSFQRNWPGVGYNQYYNNGNWYIGNGFAGVTTLDPNTGYFSLDLFPGGNANALCATGRRMFSFSPSGVGLIGANYFNANLAVSRGSGQQATACFFGTTYHSFFNESAAQHTYIRAGKANGKVYINDIPGSTILMSGNVGINTATPGVALEVYQNGPLYYGGLSLVATTTYNSWQFFSGPNGPTEALFLHHRYQQRGFFDEVDGHYEKWSDARLKTSVEELPNILSKIMALQPVQYEMSNFNPSHKQSIGFIAQDVRTLFSAIVSVSDSVAGYSNMANIHAIDYSSFGVLAIKTIQEQQKEISELTGKLISLKQSRQLLISRLVNLEEE